MVKVIVNNYDELAAVTKNLQVDDLRNILSHVQLNCTLGNALLSMPIGVECTHNAA